MGTRGVTEVIYNGKLVVSQYGQWDHYPMGQGLAVLNFLRSQSNIDNLRANIDKLYYPKKWDLQQMYAEYFDENGLASSDDAEAFNKRYPSLLRDTGAGILEIIANATEIVPIQLEPESFKDDRLFCEGVYTINLDDDTFTTRFNRYENPNDEDVLTISFSEAQTITDDEYLTRAKCGVYQYQKAQAV